MYLGNEPSDKFLTLEKQSFSVSATTNYTLSHSVSSPQEIRLVINNVPQNGTALTLSSATSSGDTMYCVFLGKAIGTVGVPVNGVGTSQLSDDAVTSSKIADSVKLGKIGQVVSTTKTDTATISSSGFADVSGLTLNITPSATSSKVLIKCNITLNHTDVNHTVVFRFLRETTAVGVGASAGNRLQASAATATVGGGDHPQTIYAEFLDSPSASAEITYKIQIANQDGAAVTVNRNNTADTDSANADFSRYASTITAMEVLA